jgi:translocation and assembly module TamB
MRRWGRIVVRIFLAAAVLMLAALIAGVFVVRSGWFRERIRERIVSEIEKATGGAAEIRNFSFHSERLTATLDGLVLHGREKPGDPPLLAVNSITIGFRVISIFERRIDLSYLRVQQPRVRVVFYPDGSNNLLATRGNWAREILNVAIGRYEIEEGVLDYDQRRVRFDLHGEHLSARMNYDVRGPRYSGEIASRALRIAMPGAGALEANLSAALAIDANGIDVKLLRLAWRDSRAELSGRLNDPRSLQGTLRVTAAMAIRDVAELLALPVARTGVAAFDGQLAFSFADASLAGRMKARGIGYARDRIKMENADVAADLRLTRDGISLRGISAHIAGGTIDGAAVITNWREMHFDGNLAGFTVRQAAAMATGREIPWSGALAAQISLNATIGRRDCRLNGTVAITPQNGGAPIEGRIEASYDQASNKIDLKRSFLATSATRVEVAGVLGESLEVEANSTNLDDFLPALAMVESDAPRELPLKLANGRASFDGRVRGSLEDAQAAGQLTITHAALGGHAFDRFSARINANRARVGFDRATLARGEMEVTGSGAVEKDAIVAQLSFRNAPLTELAKEAGFHPPISGIVSGTARVFGSPEKPEAEAAVRIDKPAGFGEQLDRLNAVIRYSPEMIAVSGGEASAGAAKMSFEVEYRHRDWNNGEAKLAFNAQQVELSSLRIFAKLQSGMDATIRGNGAVTAKISNGKVELQSISAHAAASGARWNRLRLGEITVDAETHGSEVAVRAAGRAREIAIQAQGAWKLAGDMPGSASVQISRANLATIHDVLISGGSLEAAELPFEGFLDGITGNLSMALRKPREFHAELTAGVVEVHPRANQALRLGAQAQDIALRAAKPVVVEITAAGARIRSAQFAARDTSLEASGAISFDGKTGSDITVRGSVNLIILQLLNPDLAARGNATVQTSIRGSVRDPQVNGRMELRNASLYLGDLPNGVDNANGAVIFDRNRATIEKLTAETGGGKVNLAGFIGFGSPLVYRLQASIDKVRVRYPEDVSVTFDAALALNGTSDASTVSGAVTLTRAAFTARADLARVLAQTATTLPAPAASSAYLRGMQFDVRIESGPGFALETSLTRNLEAEVDLRLRGTPLRPALLGTISVNEGEAQVFGNRYTVNRGDIRFVNAVKIDPIFDIELETKARGVTVNISIAGTVQKLNVNYSSDPPMQPREIIALLAVGRSPEEVAGLNPDQYSSSGNSLSQAGGGLISEAITAQLSSRLQRFFGSSRVKIDPTLTGAEYLPQARLTFEQQVSNDITLTYITNLNRTQEQIVQIEYDFSRQWSAIATREANGLFGIDFQYKRRFK